MPTSPASEARDLDGITLIMLPVRLTTNHTNHAWTTRKARGATWKNPLTIVATLATAQRMRFNRHSQPPSHPREAPAHLQHETLLGATSLTGNSCSGSSRHLHR